MRCLVLVSDQLGDDRACCVKEGRRLGLASLEQQAKSDVSCTLENRGKETLGILCRDSSSIDHVGIVSASWSYCR